MSRTDRWGRTQRESALRGVLSIGLAAVMAFGSVPAPALAEAAKEAGAVLEAASAPEGARPESGDASGGSISAPGPAVTPGAAAQKRTITAVPAAAERLVYDGTEQVGVGEGEGYELQGDVKAVHAGSYVATATPAEGYAWADGSAEPVELRWSIAPRPATVRADNKEKAAGEPDPALTATVEGLVGDDKVDYELSREPGEEPGEYAITPEGDAAQGDYEVSFETGTLGVREGASTPGVTGSKPAEGDAGKKGLPVEGQPTSGERNDQASEEESARGHEALATDGGIVATGDELQLGDAPEASPGLGMLSTQSTIQYAQPQPHTKQEIRDFVLSHPFDLTSDNTYASEPSASAPFAPGALSDKSVRDAVNVLNSLRFIAGVGSNVTNNESYQAYAQAAALVNKANDVLSHYPTQPAGMDDALYQQGKTGAGSSNISKGRRNAAQNILGCFNDLGANNSGVAGHRRWLVSSRLGQVGIGHVDNYGATYVFDDSDPSNVTDVAWPARVMPTNFIDTQAQWSLSTVTQNIGTPSSISVRVVRQRDNKVWDLSSSDVTVNEVTEYGSFIGYDKNGCIVWSMPDVGWYLDGDVYDVTITGDVSKKSYSVEFFDLFSVDKVDVFRPVSGNYEEVPEDASLQKIVGAGERLTFVPGYSEDSLPADAGLQSIAEEARKSQAITYSSSNESVATIVPANTREYKVWYEPAQDYLPGDWFATVSAKGPGTATLTATLSNGVQRSVTIKVRKKSIDPDVDAKATISAQGGTTFTYNGQAQHPTYVVRYNGTALTEGTDYKVTYADDVNAGTGTATIEGMGTYEGQVQKTFTINRASLSSATMASVGSRTYTGSAIEPTPAVAWGGRTLVAGSDYELSYANNTNVGMATVTATGKGNYTGSKSVTFSIAAASIADATVGSIPEQTYAGSELTPEPTVTWGGRDLAKGTDYTLSYSGNTDAGTATVTVTGRGNFTGTKSVTFSIAAASIADAVLGSIPGQTYTGSELTPEPTVTWGGRALAKETDYTLSYSGNTDVGIAKVTVAGRGNFTGTTEKTFSIGQASLAEATVETIPAQVHTGQSLEPKPVIVWRGRTLLENVDYTLSYGNNVELGTSATVTATGKGNFCGEKTANFSIVPKSVEQATVSQVSDCTYTGGEHRPTPLVTLGGQVLKEGTDYTLSYENNVNVGKATITIRGAGAYGGEKTATFKIAAADLSGASVSTIPDQTYTGSVITPRPTVTLGGRTLVAGTDYVLSYEDNVKAGTATVTAMGKGNYTLTKSASFRINKAASSVSLAAQTLTYNGKAQGYSGKVTRSGSGGAVTYAYYSDAACTRAVAAADVKAAGTYYVRATLAADANHDGATSAAARLVIGKAASKVSLAAQTKTYDGRAQAYSGKVTRSGSGGKVTYAYYSDAACRKAVAAANVKAAGTYYVRATLAADANHNGATSAAARLVVARAKVAVPRATNRPYTGKQQVGVPTGAGYALKGTPRATKAGTYTVTATPDANHCWADGKADARKLTWRIVAPSVRYRTHVQTYGNQAWKANGQASGTFGQAKRLEGIWIELPGRPVSGSIQYRTHVQTFGWQGWRGEGAMSGTSGLAKRLEAIQIRLTGNMAKTYDVWYRVHAQTYGWMGWARNGAQAGTAGWAKRLEAIQILVLPKGSKAPASNYGGYRQATSAPFVKR